MIKRKRITCFLAVLLIAVVGIGSCFIQWVHSSENGVTYDQYKADYYINYSPYKYFKTEEFKLPYRTIVEKNRDNLAYNSLINAWEIATFDLSKVTEYSKKRIGYYEAFLFDILYNGYEPENVTLTMDKCVKSVQASTFKKISTMVEQSATDYAKVNISKMSDKEKDALCDALKSCNELKDIFGTIGNIEKVLKYASNVEELIYKLAKVEAISKLSVDNAVILERVSANTDDMSLSAACLELASICRGEWTESQIIALMTSDMVMTEMANYALSTIWGEVVENLTGYGIAISVGQNLGKWVSDVLFSGSKQIETYYEMKALYDFEDEMRKAVSYYESRVKSSNTQENAKLFNTSLELLLSTFELGCDISVEYASENYESGVVNLFISYVSGNDKKFQDFKNSANNVSKEIQLLIEYANADLYNCYVDEYCEQVSDIVDVSPVETPLESNKVETIELELKDNLFKCSDVTIKKDTVLSHDLETYGDVYISGGTLDLNGHTLKIQGNLNQTGGVIDVNAGTLDIEGDYRIQSQGRNVEGETVYGDTAGYLIMQREKDNVKVKGSFFNQHYIGVGGNKNVFSAGIMEIGGDFYQLNGLGDNFKASGTHKVILNGTGKQKVSFDSTSSCFNDLELANNDVEFMSEIKGWTLQRDTTFKYGLEKGMTGTFDLNGYTMKVLGNLNQTGGVIDVNAGTLDIEGDYRIQSQGKNVEGEMVYGNTSGYLIMQRKNDCVKIGGSFFNQHYIGVGGNKNVFSAGIMEIGGDFYQLNGLGDNFKATGTHTVILNGKEKQTVKFESTSSHFNNLKLIKDKDTGYSFSLENCWNNLYLDTDVKSVSITPNQSTVVQNDSQQFIAKVEGINKPDQSVVWKLSGNTSKDTTISENGLLKVSLEEKAEQLTVTATSVLDNTKHKSVTVKVEKAIPVVNWVKISPSNLIMGQGETRTLSANVYGVNNPSQKVKWNIEGNTSKGTVISDVGALTIGNDETTDTIKVTAVSEIDNTKSAYIIVTILYDNEEPMISEVTKVRLSVTDVSMTPGDKYIFNATVYGSNSPSQNVIWSIQGNKSENTKIDTNGVLLISEDETAETIGVTATSTVDSTKYAQATVILIPVQIVSTVDKVTIFMNQGSSQLFSAKVTGANNPNQEVVWSISGNESEDTRISDDGELVIAEDETAETIIIKATSIENSNKYGLFAIRVLEKEIIIPDTPSRPSLESLNGTTVVLKKVDGYEYCVDDGEWQSSNVFENLEYGHTYKFYQRVAETEENKASMSSESLSVTIGDEETSGADGETTTKNIVEAITSKDNETTIKDSVETTTQKAIETTKKNNTETTTKPIEKNTTPSIEITSKTSNVKKPKASKIKKIKQAKKSLKITWRKIKGVNGYQIQYSTSSKFKKAKKITIKKAKTTSKTIKKLKAKKKYYVRIRTYITVNGKKKYSNWSKKKSQKTK